MSDYRGYRFYMRPPKLANPHARAVLYLRVSQDRKGKQKSLGEQEADARRSADSEQLEVVRVFADNDRSASRFAKKVRPEYQALREYLATGQVDVLILWESSRGSRELEDWAGLLNLCRRHGVRIRVHTHDRTYDLDNPRDWRTLAEDGIDSQYESEKTSKRVRRAVAASQSAGTPFGKLLYGYQRVFDRFGNVRWVIHDEQAEIVREAARRAAKGEALYAIAADFNARGIATPRSAALPRMIEAEKDEEKRAKLIKELETANYTWDLTQIKRLCCNPAYIGKRASQSGARQWKIHSDATWDAILDDEVHQTCVDILNRPERETRKVIDSTVKHLLSGIAFSPCGGIVRVQDNRGYPAYCCERDYCVTLVKSRADAFIEQQVKEHLIRSEIRELEEDIGDQDAIRQRAKDEAQELRDYLDNFTKEAVSQRLSATAVAQVEQDVMAQIAALEATARRPVIPAVIRVLVHEPEKWDDMSMPEKRETLRRLVRITILPIGRGKKNYDTADRFDLDWTEFAAMRDVQSQLFE